MTHPCVHRYLLAGVASLAIITGGNSFGQQVINIPPQEPLLFETFDGGEVVNVLPDGFLRRATVTNDTHLNLSGGEIAELLVSEQGSARIDSGRVSSVVEVGDGGSVSQHGGIATRGFLLRGGSGVLAGGAIGMLGSERGSSLVLQGTDFTIDGAPLLGLGEVGDSLSIDLPNGSFFSGILSDGTPFVHHQSFDSETSRITGSLTLERTENQPTPVPSTTTITDFSALRFLGDQQTAIIQSGGQIQKGFRAGPGSLLNVDGGYIDTGLDAIGAEIVLDDGTIGRQLRGFRGSNITVNGGLLSGDATLFSGSTLNVAGGEVGRVLLRDGATTNLSGGLLFNTFGFDGSVINVDGGTTHQLDTNGGEINISGGTIAHGFSATQTARVVISGGSFPNNIQVNGGAKLSLHGTDFRVNGQPIQGLDQIGNSVSQRLSDGILLSGVFSDGTPFSFDGDLTNITEDITLLTTDVQPPSGPSILNIPNDIAPHALRSGQTLNLGDGGELPPLFAANEARLFITGGSVGNGLKLIASDAQITGGQLRDFEVNLGSSVEISGDASWGVADIREGGTLTMNGGSGGWVRADPESNVEVNDGTLGLLVANNNTVRVSGGEIDALALNQSSGIMSGGTISSELNVSDGAEFRFTGGKIDNLLASGFNANVAVHIEGGEVDRLQVSTGSVTNVTGGVLAETDAVGNGAILRFLGGALGESHEWLSGSVELHGFDFRVDGEPVEGLETIGNTVPLNFRGRTTLSGILADGTPIHLGDEEHTSFFVGNIVSLTRTERPSVTPLITLPEDKVPVGAMDGQTIVVNAGGQLGDYFLAAEGSRVNINGGIVGEEFEAIGSQITLDGGEVGAGMDILQGATFSLRAGSIGRFYQIQQGGTLEVLGGETRSGRCSGGSIDMSGGRISEITLSDGCAATVDGGQMERITLQSNANLNVLGGSVQIDNTSGVTSTTIRGGNVAKNASFGPEAKVELFGGAIADGFRNEGALDVHGVDFEIDGVPVAGLDQTNDVASIVLSDNQVLAGVLSDGSPFVFTGRDSDRLGTLRLVRSEAPTPGDSVIQLADANAPNGVGDGQQIDVLPNGVLPANFNAGRGSVVNVNGGTVGDNLEIYKSEVNLSSGQVEGSVDVFSGGNATLQGGQIGGRLNAYDASNVHVAGATILGNLRAFSGATAVITSGEVSQFSARPGSNVSMEGGIVSNLTASEGSNVQLSGGRLARATLGGNTMVLGGQFELNGQPIESLVDLGSNETINTGDRVLTGLFADGTPFFLQSALPIQLSTVELQPIPALNLVASVDGIPLGLATNQRLTIDAGEELPASYPLGRGATLIVEDGGSAGAFLQTIGATVDVLGGYVGQQARIGPGTQFRVAAGRLDRLATVFDGGTFNLVGGTVDQLRTQPGSTTSIGAGSVTGRTALDGDVDISGGTFATEPTVSGKLTLRGGNVRFRGPFRANFVEGSSVIIEGTKFVVDGEELNDLPLNELVDIGVVPVSGTLADGSSFEITPAMVESIQVRRTTLLADFNADGTWTTFDADHLCGGLAAESQASEFDLNRDAQIDRYDLNRFLILTNSVAGDFDLDGTASFADFLRLSSSFGREGNWSDGDATCDGQVNFEDFLVLSQNFGTSQIQAVPEPSGISLLFIMTAILCTKRRPSRQH